MNWSVLFEAAGLPIAAFTPVAPRLRPLVYADERMACLLVAGYRGAPPADPAALTDLIHRLSRLGEDLPEVAELDLNPVIAGPDGCVVVDARVRVEHPQKVARTKTW